ncbi:MAG: hypothetical protein JNK87_08965 [Bryobacterales bacterium]|nr:hypothetical protein [Bryobacterales bacterium]
MDLGVRLFTLAGLSAGDRGLEILHGLDALARKAGDVSIEVAMGGRVLVERFVTEGDGAGHVDMLERSLDLVADDDGFEIDQVGLNALGAVMQILGTSEFGGEVELVVTLRVPVTDDGGEVGVEFGLMLGHEQELLGREAVLDGVLG